MCNAIATQAAITAEQRALVRDFTMLPEGERAQFRHAIAERAAFHRSNPIEIGPPIVVRLVSSAGT